MRVRTETGDVVGIVDRGSVVFHGIPYAAPPFGACRFREPQPAERWAGIRDASRIGVGAPQPRFPDDPLDAYFNPRRQGEDCLTLDVRTPDPGTAGLPVLVWIHGGGFMTGTGSAPAHEGATFARDGFVHVGINYRLGIEGFTHFPDGPDNLGLRDQIAALEWVQRNIAGFGGDPSQVTVFGQSAGGVSVIDLLAAPRTRGLFARAIAMSGSPRVAVDAASAARVTARLAERLGTAPTRAAFAAVPLERTLAETLPMALEFADPGRSGAESFMVSPYRAVHGTEILPEPPLTAGPRSTVPLLIGSTRNECTGFLRGLGLADGLPGDDAERMLSLLGADDAIRDAYVFGPRRLTGGLPLVEAAWTDAAFRMPGIRLAEERTGSTHVYEFRWESPSLPRGLGADHALDVPFMRDDLAALRATGPVGAALLGPDAPQGLATAVHAAFAGFARDGDPGWSPYGSEHRTTMLFDTTSAVASDPAAPERVAWAGVRW